MMIKRDTHTQTSPSNTWEVTLPTEATKGRVLAVYDDNGASVDIDTWHFENGVLTAYFGIDTHTGTMEYEYQLPHEGTCNPDAPHNHQLVYVNHNYGGLQVDSNGFHR